MDIATLPVGTPTHIEPGMMWMEPIANIRSKFSIDFAVPDDYAQRPESKYKDNNNVVHTHKRPSWDDVLTDKRTDDHYPEVVESIRKRGWVRPVTVQLTGDADVFQYGDGHHRLAAAIDLGFTHIPVEAVDVWGEPVSDDSGSWHEGRTIATSNGSQVTYRCSECWERYSQHDDMIACEESHEAEYADDED